ncbi:MAG: PIN domain-containing protein [Spirochaetales bacterium]|nr:PIN domain-containing protein [Spirochaetales bacterium]
MSGEIVFFDTNTLVYANDGADPAKRVRAREVIREAIITGTGCISTQVLAEFWVTVTKKLKRPLSVELAREQIHLFSAFRIMPVEQTTVLETLRIQERWQLSYWDAQILASALQARASSVYSEDLQDGCIIEGISVTNPFNSLQK